MTDDPLDLFTRWFEEAREQGAFEPQAVALATATPDGVPSARMVLMKGFDERGLTFFTNYASRKGDELEANPRAALLFHWPEVGRQVRIEGSVSRVDRSGDRGVRAQPRARQPAERAGVAAEPAGPGSRLARAAGRGARPRARRRRAARVRRLGRLPPGAACLGVLGTPAQPAA